MAGIEQIPLRIPDRWDPVWFETFVREVLAKADARNAIPGLGITIEGRPDQPATISSNTDVDQLVDENYIVAESSPLLPNARTLDGEGGVLEVTDSGPGGIVRISVAAHGISYSKFRLGRPCSVVGRPDDSVGEQTSIEAAANDTVLRRVGDTLEFGSITFPMVQLSGPGKLLGRASADAGPMEEITLGTGLSLDGTTLNATGGGGGGGGGGGALVYVNTSIPSGNTIANTASETAFDSSYTIPADTLEAGMIVRVRLFGVFSTTGTPTLQLRIKLGSTTYIDTGAITLPENASDMGFYVDAQLVVHSDGATGEIDAQGVAMIGLTSETAQVVTIPSTSTVTTDTTGSLALSVTAEWGEADASNAVTLRQLAVWMDNLSAPSPDFDLATEILADSPTGFWKCDDVSDGFADSSGNGYNLTTLHGTVTLQDAALIPTQPNARFARIASASGYRLTSTMGVTNPLTGDYTLEAVICLPVISAGCAVLSSGAVGETEGSNFQFELSVSTTGVLGVFWEHGNGQNDAISSGVRLSPATPYHLVVVKDGTANTVTFYANGIKVAAVSYSNEPSGGSDTPTVSIGQDINNAASDPLIVGYVAFYNGTKLSASRVVAHARAAGLF